VEESDVRLWETATATLKKRWPYPRGGGPKPAAFTPDSRFFVTGHTDGKVRIQGIDSLDASKLISAHQDAVRSVSFSPDGSTVLTAGDDGSARIWNAANGRAMTPPMKHLVYIQSAAFSGDGRYVVTAGGDNTARVWEAATGRAVCLPLQHQGTVQPAEMSQDGSTILTGSYDYTARTWALPHDPPWQSRLDLKADVRMAAFHPDGMRLITVSQQPEHRNQAQLFDLQTGAPLGAAVELGVDDLVRCAVNKDGRLVVAAAGNGSVHVCDPAQGRDVNIHLTGSSQLRVIAFQADSLSLLAGTVDGEVQAWDVETGQPLGEPLAHKEAVDAVAVSADGTKALVGCWDRWAHLWDLAARRTLKSFLHQDPLTAVALSPDGRLLATGAGKVIRIWNASGKFEQRFSLADPFAVAEAAFSHRGRLLATGSTDGVARLWDVATGKQIGPPLFHDLTHSSSSDRWAAGPIRSVEFSSDDTRVLTAGTDQSLRIWPVPEPLAGSAQDIIRHIEALTIMELDSAGAPGDLDLRAWQARRGRPPGLH
jgi:WD40 repeat protein